MRQFGEDGFLTQETHCYGCIDIGIQYDFRDGIKVDELYFAKSRLISRRSYEKARLSYSDMPAADGLIQDGGGELLKALYKERRQHRAETKKRQPDSDNAPKCDAFCLKTLQNGKKADAVRWARARNHTLGERSWSNSKRLVERFSALGCLHVYACKIDVYEDGSENTGHLVIELPSEANKRGKILKLIDRLASENGYRSLFDDGQRYAYVKLD